jgi:Protein of unknown function (DUF3306)
MTDLGQLLFRWSRLKRTGDSSYRKPPVPRTPTPDGGSTTGEEPSVAAGNDGIDGHAVNLESLPPLSAITGDTDIRPFLQRGVPAELTQAALCRAWTSDPAIRDFIGIAESQWDFTAPETIPGFGPDLPAEDVAQLISQMLGEQEEDLPEDILPETNPSDAIPKRIEGRLCSGKPTVEHS